MICRRCRKEVQKGWRYCPKCGSVIQQGRSIFDDIFSRFRKDFKDMDKMFGKDFEPLDLSPFFRRMQQGAARPRGAGFTIKITRRNNEQPKVDVRPFGNINQGRAGKEPSRGMVPINIKQVPAGTMQRPPETPEQEAPSQPVKSCEEPKTSVKSMGNKVMVEMEIPDVKSEKDVQIRQLESSVEVMARAGDKAYFKIITKPEKFSVTSKRLEKGRLFLEFS